MLDFIKEQAIPLLQLAATIWGFNALRNRVDTHDLQLGDHSRRISRLEEPPSPDPDWVQLRVVG